MKKIFGAKKDKGPPPSIQDATERVSLYSTNPLLLQPCSCCPLLYCSSNQ
jgi:hypothetical protein